MCVIIGAKPIVVFYTERNRQFLIGISKGFPCILQVIDGLPCWSKPINCENMIWPCLVRGWMEIPDVAMVCKKVKIKALFNRLARYLVGIGGTVQ